MSNFIRTTAELCNLMIDCNSDDLSDQDCLDLLNCKNYTSDFIPLNFFTNCCVELYGADEISWKTDLFSFERKLNENGKLTSTYDLKLKNPKLYITSLWGAYLISEFPIDPDKLDSSQKRNLVDLKCQIDQCNLVTEYIIVGEKNIQAFPGIDFFEFYKNNGLNFFEYENRPRFFPSIPTETVFKIDKPVPESNTDIFLPIALAGIVASISYSLNKNKVNKTTKPAVLEENKEIVIEKEVVKLEEKII